jgi:hypothetical protein
MLLLTRTTLSPDYLICIIDALVGAFPQASTKVYQHTPAEKLANSLTLIIEPEGEPWLRVSLLPGDNDFSLDGSLSQNYQAMIAIRDALPDAGPMIAVVPEQLMYVDVISGMTVEDFPQDFELDHGWKSVEELDDFWQ